MTAGSHQAADAHAAALQILPVASALTMDLEGAVLEGELAEGQQIAALQNAQDHEWIDADVQKLASLLSLEEPPEPSALTPEP